MPEQLAILNAACPPVTVHLFGLGLVGANVLSQLVFIRETLWQLSERPLRVSAYDRQTVTPAHLGPYRLPEGCLGQPLAQTLIGRLNLAGGLDWHGSVSMRGEQDPSARRAGGTNEMHIFVSAVNSLGERREIDQHFRASTAPRPTLWMDLGRDGAFGHVILGRRADRFSPSTRLPTFGVMYPELMVPDGKTVQRAAPFDLSLGDGVPELLSGYAGRLLWTALQPIPISQRGYLFNLETGQVGALPVDDYQASGPQEAEAAD